MPDMHARACGVRTSACVPYPYTFRMLCGHLTLEKEQVLVVPMHWQAGRLQEPDSAILVRHWEVSMAELTGVDRALFLTA